MRRLLASGRDLQGLKPALILRSLIGATEVVP
jgi:hypothetical protein